MSTDITYKDRFQYSNRVRCLSYIFKRVKENKRLNVAMFTFLLVQWETHVLFNHFKNDCCTETYPCMLYRWSLFKSQSTSSYSILHYRGFALYVWGACGEGKHVIFNSKTEKLWQRRVVEIANFYHLSLLTNFSKFSKFSISIFCWIIVQHSVQCKVSIYGS